jgi:hypothetical protein
MAFSPPKGVRPPQFEGKRTGRPKGSLKWSALWQAFAAVHYWEVHDWLEVNGVI